MAQETQPQKRNLASEAFRRKYDILNDALAQPQVINWLAIKLYKGAIIISDTRDAILMSSFPLHQATNVLLQAVECSIKTDYKRLRKFIQMLRKQPVLEPVAKQLCQCYSELISEARLSESSSSESDTDSTEQHQSKCQGIPKNNGGGNDPSSAAVAVTPPAGIPELSMLGPCEQKAEDSGSGEESTKTKRRIEDLEKKYMALVEKTQKEVIDQKTDLETFRTKLTLLPNSMKKEHEQYLEKILPQLVDAKSIHEIFIRLNLYWNYLHYGMLQHIIDIYGADDTKALMKSYVKDVKSFQQETTLAMFWKAGPRRLSDIPNSIRKELSEVLTSHKDLTSKSSLKSIQEFRQKFACKIPLPEFAIVIKDIMRGSIIIVWLIPAKGAMILREQVEEGRIEFFKQHHILELRINDSIIYSAGEPTRRTVYICSLKTVEMEPAQEAKLLSALESADFDTALQHIPTGTPALVRLGPNKLTPLHYACQHGRLDVIRSLVTKYPHDVQLLSEGTCSPLHIATKYGQFESVKFLVENKLFDEASVNACGTNTPLHIAAEEGHINIAALLVEKNVCKASTVVNSNGDSPLHVAAACNQLSIIKYFITQTHCNPAIKNNQNSKTPLHLAAEKGCINIVKYLIEEQHCDPSCTDADGNTPLHLAAGKGQMHVVQLLITEKHCNPMCATTVTGRTPLHIASHNGHLSVVQYLLTEHHCTPSCTDNRGITPLHLASQEGHLDVVMFLSENDSNNLFIADSDGNTPLHTAAEHGNLLIVDYLIKSACDPAMKNIQNSRTPLHLAAEHGHPHVAQYLIDEQHCDPSATDEKGKTPLYLAAGNGKLQVVEFLIAKKKCNPMHTSTEERTPGRTPLHSACSGGHLSVVKFLVNECGCKPSCSDEDGFTPLHLASMYGHLKLVHFLIKEKHCNPMHKSTGRAPGKAPGRTPLHGASFLGHFDVVQCLVSEQKCNPCISDEDGYTPLHFASQEGHLQIVKFFVKEQTYSLSAWLTSNPAGRTPLHSASMKGQMEVMKFLIEENFDPTCTDEYDWTPLHLAAANGHSNVVQYLVEEKQCDPMCKTKTGMTPLHLASKTGHLRVIKCLTEDAKCDSMCLDEDGWCAVHLAALNGHAGIVRWLIEEKLCNPMCTTKRGYTPLHMAAQNGHLEVVKYLREDAKCEAMCPDEDNWCAVHLAALNGHTEVVRWLIEDKQCDLMCMTITVGALLHLAAKHGHLEVAKYLTEDHKCDSMCLDEDNCCAVHFAALNGHTEIVRWLIEETQCNPMCTDKRGYTPLHMAAQNGHTEVVQFLVEEKQCDLMCKTKTGMTPLHLASQNGHLEVLKHLILYDRCDPMCMQSDDQYQWYPLHFAARNGHAETIIFLVEEKKCDLMCKTKTGRTPLHLASQNGHLEIVKYLTGDAISDSMCLDENDWCAVHFAALNGHTDIVRLLIVEKQCNPMCTVKGRYTPLHMAAFKGHTEIVQFLVEKELLQCDLMRKTETGMTPLHLASQNGHLEVVKYLTEDAKCDSMCLDEVNWCAIHFAACNGHVEIVQFLVEERKCDPMCKTNTGKTPLHLASQNGHLEVVKYLTGDAESDSMCLDKNDWCAVHFAALNGHTDIVRLLIVEKQFNPMCTVKGGYTPLHMAAFKGHTEIVQFLVEKELLQCDLMCKTETGMTPLHLASQNGHLEVVKYLTEDAKCDSMCLDEVNWCAIHFAARNGHVEIVQFLVEERKCDPMCKTNTGGTPLHLASETGHLEVVKYLTGDAKSDPMCLDENNCCAVHFAALNGHTEIVRWLVVEKQCNPMCTVMGGHTPLHMAAFNGNAEIVQFLVEKEQCDMMCKTETGRTPLHFASQTGHLEVVKYLIGCAKCDSMCLDENYCCAVHFAAHNGHTEIVRWLIEEKQCNPMCTAEGGHTPLHLAALNGHTEIVQFLVEEKQCDPMCKTKTGMTPLHIASYNGHLQVVKYLIQNDRCNPTCTESYQWYPIHFAAFSGHKEIVQYLVVEKKYDPMCKTKTGMTPLHLASHSGHLKVVKYLTEDARCDSMCLDKNNCCAVHFAAHNGHTEIVRWLVEEKQCNPMCTAKRGHTPLHMAAENGHAEVVQFLVKFESEVDPMCQDKLGMTPLHMAAVWGQVDIVNFLFNNRNCDPAHKAMIGFTPLHAAAIMGQHRVVKALLENHYIPITTDDFGQNALHYAVWGLAYKNVSFSEEFPDILKVIFSLMCMDTMLDVKLLSSEFKECYHKGSHSEVMRLLLNVPNCDTAAILNCKASDGTTPLHNACFLGQYETIKLISGSSNVDFTVTDNNGLSPLHYALVGRNYPERHCWDNFQSEDDGFQSHNLWELIGIDDEKKIMLLNLLLKYSNSRDYLSICQFLLKECHLDPFVNKDKYGDTPLHYAARMKDTEAFKLLAGENILNSLCSNNYGVTTLHIASGNGNTAIVKFLVNDCRVQPMCKCKSGTTPLHWASETGHLDIVKILTSQMPANYLDQRDSSGRSPLFYAATRGQLNVLQYFIQELNCDPFCQDHAGNTILHYASLRGFTAIVQYLVTPLNWSGVLTNKTGFTPLYLAAWKGHLETVQLLIDPAYQRILESDMGGNTPLHIAASEGYKEIVSCLAGQKDFDINCTTASGNTALHDACRKGHLDIVKFLVDSPNCNILLANNIGATPLHLSVAFGHEDIVHFLCSKKSYHQFCSTVTVYWTPLHLVCSSGLEKNLALRIAQMLLDQVSCDPSCTFKGVSPLHLASYSENLSLVKFLVCERGCDPLKPENSGKLALHYAVKGQNTDVADFLISCNPESIMHEDQMGETPLMGATSENIVAKLLLNGADPSDIRTELSNKMSYLNNYVHLRGRSNVYIVGNHSSGKSTLISAIESEHKGFFERFPKVTASRDTTAGIKSSVYEKSKCFGPVVFHDFAGEAANYCGHPALLKGSGKPVFIIVTNLTDPLVDIKNQISYWLQWVSNLCSAAMCHSSVMIVGNRRYLTPQDLREKNLYLQTLPVSDEVTLSHTTVLGGITLNCQRYHSTGMLQLRKMLQEVCIASQNVTNIHSMLLAFTKYTFTTPIQLSSVQACITENEIPLPQLLEELYKLYQDLDSSGYIVLLGNENAPEKSWIALDQKHVLHVVNKFLHDAREHPQYNSTGVVPFSELVAWFGDQFHPDFISKYLVRIEVCQQCFLHSERCYFFPILLDAMPHQNLWSFNPRYEQYFGWCLRTKPHKFFPVKFFHALFLELAFTFALQSSNKKEQCYIWKNGIRWVDMNSGTEVVVQFCEQNTTAMIMTRWYSKKGHEMKYYKYRSEVLKAFTDTSDTFGLKSVTKEYILHPHDVSKYQFFQPNPVSNLKRFDVSEIAKTLIEQRSLLYEDKAAKSTQKRDLDLPDTEIEDLLHFDPFLGIQTETLQTLFSDTTENITPSFLQGLLDDKYVKQKKLEVLAEIFRCHNPQETEHVSFEIILKELLDREETVAGLCHKLHQYSIFCGRNILEIAGSLHQLSDTVTETSQVDPWSLTSDIQVPTTCQNASTLAVGSFSMTSRDAATLIARRDIRANWEYWKLFRASADVITALANNHLSNTLANHLKARNIIGQAVYEQATNYGPNTTESMRVGHLMTALLSKVKEDPQYYHDFIQILQLDGIHQDAEAALKLLPTADDIASRDIETVKDDEKVVSQSDHRPVSPVWKLASSTPLDVAELSDIRSELIHDVTEWFPLGLALGLDSPNLEKIQHNNQGQVDKCMADMLDAWLRQKGHVASWQTLAEALSQPTVNKVALARRIATTYTSVSPETLVGLVH